MNWARVISIWLVALAALLISAQAFAAVKKEGNWPEADKKITLDLDGVARPLALRKLADAAGWSLVVQTPWEKDAGRDAIDIHVKDQPAGKVLELVLSDGA